MFTTPIVRKIISKDEYFCFINIIFSIKLYKPSSIYTNIGTVQYPDYESNVVLLIAEAV